MDLPAPYISIGVFIDGGYLAKVNEGLERQSSLNIHITSLFGFLKKKIAEVYLLNVDNCKITESHYFRGRYRVSDASNKNLLYSERKFEDSLIENDVVFHYKHLREFQKDGNTTIVEKGIDVWFALEAFELSLLRKFDFVVLMTGDADHEMLARKLKAMKVRVILLSWDLWSQSATSRLLKEEVGYHIELNDIISQDPNILAEITYRK